MTGTNVFQLLGKLAIDGVDETKKALDDVAKGGEDAGKKLKVSFQDIGTKAGELGRTMATGLTAGIAAITATYEATKEFRMDLGRLEAGYEGVGLSGETANKVFKDFYGVLGETDTAVEASNLLKELAQDEKGLAEWTDIATGVYARFPDSLPIEALIESANETAKVGQITGNFADAINWASKSGETFGVKLKANTKANEEWNKAVQSATSAEEYFNLALLECNTEAEREELIRNTLNDLYKDSAKEYQKTNKGLIDNNKAQADLNMQMADAMAKVEPLITKGKIFLTEVLLKLQPAITWIIDNINILAPIILTFMGSLFALNIASKIMTLIPILQLLFTTLMANPIVLIITAIIGAIILLIANWDKVKEVTLKVWEVMKDAVQKGVDFIVQWFNKIVNFVKENWQGLLLLLVNPFAGAFKLLYDNCEGFRNFVDKWIKKIRDFFVNGFNTIKNKVVSTVTNLVDGVRNKINAMRESVSNTFNKIKDGITKPVEKARDAVKKIVDKIKGFFDFEFKLPKIKTPKFSITPSGWKVGDLLEGSIPKLGVTWNAEGAIFSKPTIFNTRNGLQGVGEAGAEAIAPISKLMDYTRIAVSESNEGLGDKLDNLINLLSNYLPALSNRQVVLSTGELVGAMVNPMDKALGQLASDRRRGR